MNADEIKAIVSNIEYKDWTFRILQATGAQDGPLFLQVKFVTVNVVTGLPYTALGRKWLLSEHMVKSELVGTALKAVLAAEEHEARELFKYNAKAIFNPHIDVDALRAACDTIDARVD
jgi:hypothetical protein